MEASRENPRDNSQNMALRVTAGRDEGKIFLLTEGFIGKKESCDIRLTDPGLSALHARISLRRDAWVITDLTTAPDIRVNNMRVKSRQIQFGDTLSICDTTMQVVAAPEGVQKPRKIETKRMPAVKKNAPPSQTMAISLDENIEGWTPNKPTPKKKEQPTPQKKKREPAREVDKPVVSEDLSKYRNKAYQDDQVTTQSGSRSMVYIMVLIVVVAPILAGGIYLANKKSQKNELSRSYLAAQHFEQENPGKYSEAIEQYRRLELLATGTDATAARLAKDNIERLQTAARQYAEDLEKDMDSLDKRSSALADEGDFDAAAKIYADYKGKFQTEVAANRKTEIARLKKLASAATEVTKTTPQEPTTPAPQPAADHLAKVEAIAAAAVEDAITGDTKGAIAQLQTITSNPSLQGYHKDAENAILAMRLLQTVDKTVEASTVNGTPSLNPAENTAQPTLIRLIYSLRGGDLLAAQVLAEKMPGSLLHKELAKRSRMSAAELRKEQAVMLEFASAWSRLVQSRTRTIPRADECIRTLNQLRAAKPAKTISDFCLSMTRLNEKHAESRFIVKYETFFSACRETYSALTGTRSQVATAGNAKIIDVDANTFFFESAAPIDDPTAIKAGLFTENGVFFAPGGNIPVAARVKISQLFPVKMISDQQGSFELPIDFASKKPVKGDRIFIGADLVTGTKIIKMTTEKSSMLIYDAKLDKKHADRWSAHGARLSFAPGLTTLDASDTEGQRLAGKPRFTFAADLASKPVDIDLLITRSGTADLTIALGKLQFVIAGKEGRTTGVWFAGHMVRPHAMPRLPSGSPIPVRISYTPLSSSITVGAETVSASIDSPRAKQGRKDLEFITSGKLEISRLVITDTSKQSTPTILGISEGGTSAIISHGKSQEWASLRTGHGIFLLNKTSSKKDSSPTWKALPATIADVSAEFIICATGNAKDFVNAGTVASLTKTPHQNGAKVSATAHHLPATGWDPQAVYARIAKNAKGDPILIPDLPCSYAPRGFASKVSDSIIHPHTGERFVAYPAESEATEFTETSGTLQFPALQHIATAATPAKGLLLTGLSPAGEAMIPLTPQGFPIVPVSQKRSPQGWNVLSGNWTPKFRRIESPANTGALPLLASQSSLYENCQYSVEAKIEAASPDETTNELAIELYSPFWDRGISLLTGSHGTSIEYCSIKRDSGAFRYKSSAFAPEREMQPSWSTSMQTKRPRLQTGVPYTIKIRRARGDIAFYINGKRIATVNYPGLEGDLLLRVGCPAGRISLGNTYGTMLPRSVRIPASEPDLGEFGYILATQGADVFVDSDTAGLAQNGQISIMKLEKILTGERSKTFFLRRIAVGKVTEMTSRIARVRTSSPSEAMTAGMKVMSGLQPETLTLTAERLSSVDAGL